MQINVSFDQSQSALPTGFIAAIDYVVNYFDSLFTNNVTIGIDVGYGEIGGQALEFRRPRRKRSLHNFR